MSTGGYESPWMNESLRHFRSSVREFIEKEFVPRQTRWRQQGFPDLEAWTLAGEAGILLPDFPKEYGGGGNLAHKIVVFEELVRAGVHFGLVQSIVAHYILAYGNDDQKKKWLPSMASGQIIGAIAMTEPGAGSDLLGIQTTAIRDGDQYVINGSKKFITNGWQANVVCLAVKTDPKSTGPKGISLVMVETKNLSGYRVGSPLEKIGLPEQDACELFFQDVRVPVENLLGPSEGKGFFQMMKQLPYERLIVGLTAVATAEQAVAITSKYVKERNAFGKSLMDLQNTRFKLAECKTEAHIGRVFIDHCIERFIAGQFDGVTAAMAKYWLTDCECRVVDECLQLHGGNGYLMEYPIARMWADSRTQRIYAGANEIMKELISSSI